MPVIQSFLIFDDTGLCHYFKEVAPDAANAPAAPAASNISSPWGSTNPVLRPESGTCPGSAARPEPDDEITLAPRINGDLLSGMLSAIEVLTAELVQDKMIKIELEDNFIVFQRRNFSQPEIPVWLTLAVIGKRSRRELSDPMYFARVKGVLLRVLREYGEKYQGLKQAAGSSGISTPDGALGADGLEGLPAQRYSAEDFDQFLLRELHEFRAMVGVPARVVVHARVPSLREPGHVDDSWRYLDRYYNEFLPAHGIDVAIRLVEQGWDLLAGDLAQVNHLFQHGTDSFQDDPFAPAGAEGTVQSSTILASLPAFGYPYELTLTCETRAGPTGPPVDAGLVMEEIRRSLQAIPGVILRPAPEVPGAGDTAAFTCRFSSARAFYRAWFPAFPRFTREILVPSQKPNRAIQDALSNSFLPPMGM